MIPRGVTLLVVGLVAVAGTGHLDDLVYAVEDLARNVADGLSEGCAAAREAIGEENVSAAREALGNATEHARNATYNATRDVTGNATWNATEHVNTTRLDELRAAAPNASELGLSCDPARV